MCPSIAVLAGGGDAGGGSGKGAKDGSGDNNAGAGSGGEHASGDGRGAPDYKKYPECGYASHPVDVVTGRAFTHPIRDLALPGPLPLTFERMYSSKAAHVDMGLGFGWAHTFGWKVEVKRRSIVVWNQQGIAVDFPLLRQGEEAIGPWGWVLRREAWGFAVDADDGVWHLFSEPDPHASGFYLLTAVEDRNRNRISLTYDDGRLVEVKDSAGRVIRFSSTRERRIGSIQVLNAISQGQWIAFATYTYDEHGNLASATDADGYSSHYEYDEDHRLTLDRDRVGLAFHFVYDKQGRCVESWGDYPGRRDPSLAEGLPKWLHDGKTRAKGVHHCKFEYGDEGYSEVIDSTQSRRFFGNRHGTLDKAVEGGGVMTAAYRDDGHILSRTDAMGGRTQFDRDARGRLLRVTDPLGRTTVITRDAAGLPIRVVDPTGGITRLERDANGNILLHGDPADAVTSVTYDRGLAREIVLPSGRKLTCSYDAHGNLERLVQPNGAAYQYTYDALGRRLSVTDPAGATTRYAYSTRGDLVAIFDAVGGVTRYSYDGERHITQVTDAGGATTSFVWGGYHNLCARKDANGNEVKLAYDYEGDLVSIRNELGEEHRLTYNAARRLVSERTFDGREIHYRYDLAGRLLKIVNGAREATKLTYDLAGQLIARETADGAVEEFEYDGRGDLVRAIGPAAELVFERDAFGRVVREQQSVGGEAHAVEVTYDVDGGRVERRTTLGLVETIERGALGERLRTTLDQADVVSHRSDALGREIDRSLPGGGWIQTTYDPLGRITQRRAMAPHQERRRERGEPAWLGPRYDDVTVEASYRYDWRGEISEAAYRDGGATHYEYDPIGQLMASIPEKARSEVFRYDAAGNLHESGAGAARREYGKGSRLLRRGDTEYVWDDDGRLIEKRVRAPGGEAAISRYTWNGAGLLSRVDTPDGARVELTYDPFARRLQKKVTRPARGDDRASVSLTRFVWDGDVLVHEIRASAEAAGDPVVHERTYWFDDETFEPIAQRDGVAREGGWVYFVAEPNCAPHAIVDGGGRCLGTMEAGALAQHGSATSARLTDLRRAGQHHDEETDLVYNRWRYYCPETGRFISRDPVGIFGGLNIYGCKGNQLRNIDPYGLSQLTITSSCVVPSGGPGATPTAALLQGGKICTTDLSAAIPAGTPNTWNPNAPPTGGYSGPGFKYEWRDPSGTRYRVWGHEANPNAPPGSNAASGPHVRIRVGNRFMTDSGTTVGNPNAPGNENPTHIPLTL